MLAIATTLAITSEASNIIKKNVCCPIFFAFAKKYIHLKKNMDLTKVIGNLDTFKRSSAPFINLFSSFFGRGSRQTRVESLTCI